MAVLRGTTIGDGRLIGIELHQSVIDAEAGKRSEHMLHGVQLDIAFGKRSGTVCLRNILHRSLDLRLAFEIHSTKPDAMVRGRGQKGHIDLVAAVQANAAKAGLAGQSLLDEHVGIKPNGWCGRKPRGEALRLLLGSFTLLKGGFARETHLAALVDL